MIRTLEAWLAAGSLALFGVAVAVGGAVAGTEEPEEVFTFTDPEIVESSGLVVEDGLFVTVNDSGDTNRVFTVDPATGDTVGVTRWAGEAVDIEALAPAGRGHVWVGDTGDNLAARDSLTVTRVPVGTGDRDVAGESYELSYPDGAHDAETLLVDPATGRLHLVVKEFIGQVYAAPARLDPDGPNELTPIGDALGISTDGAFFPDGRHVILRNYGQAAVYTWPGLERVGGFDLPEQPQGEGLAVADDDAVYISTEGEQEPVLRVRIPADIRAAMAPPSASSSAEPSPGAEESAEDATEEPTPQSTQEPTQGPTDEDMAWGFTIGPWVLGGLAFAIIVVVLVRSLRPR